MHHSLIRSQGFVIALLLVLLLMGASPASTQVRMIWEQRWEEGKSALKEKRFADAEVSLRQVIDEMQTLAFAPIAAGQVFNDLAFACEAQGKNAEAESFYRQALSQLAQSFTSDSLYVANVHENLARLEYKLDKYSEAESNWKKTLTIREKRLGKTSVQLGPTLELLSLLCKTQKRYDEAIRYADRALEIYQTAWKQDNILMANSFLLLAMLHAAKHDLAKSESYCRRSLAVLEPKFGPDDPSLLSTLEIYAAVLGELRRDEEASVYAKRAAAIRAKRRAVSSEKPPGK